MIFCDLHCLTSKFSEVEKCVYLAAIQCLKYWKLNIGKYLAISLVRKRRVLFRLPFYAHLKTIAFLNLTLFGLHGWQFSKMKNKHVIHSV